MKAIFKTLSTVVGVPTFLAIFYFGLFASDVYVSEAKFSVRSSQGSTSLGGLGALLSTTVATGGAQDSQVIAEYTESHDMLDRLSRTLDVGAHYSDTDVDVLSRLGRDATRDEVLDFYREHVDIRRDLSSDVITLRVKAFSADMARALGRRIIDINERLVNELSGRMEADALDSARTEIERAVERVRTTAQDINRFQAANDSVSLQDESAALFARVAALESRLTETRAELGEKLAFMREDTADVVALKNRVTALERQLSLEKGRVIGDGDGKLGGLLQDFSPLMLEREIAQQQYASALAGFEAARADAARQKQYLITIVEPSLPDAAQEPHRLNKVLTVMIFSFLTYLIGGLLWSALKDHIGH